MPVLTQHSRPSFQEAESTSQRAFPNLRQGLTAAWVPILGPTGTTLFDVSGHGADGTLVGRTADEAWIVDRGAYAISFDGTSSDSVNLGPSTLRNLGTADFTLFTIVVFNDADNRMDFFMTYDGNGWIFRREESRGCSFITFTPGDDGSAGFGTLSDNTEYSLVAKRDGAVLTTWRDGLLITTDATASGNADSNDNVYLGSFEEVSNPLDGHIYIAMQWDRALSPNEIQQLYIDPVAPFRRRRNLGLLSVEAEAAAGHNVHFMPLLGVA